MIWIFLAEIFRLIQIKTILTNSTFNINEIVGKATDDDDDEYIGSDESFELDGDNDLKNVYVKLNQFYRMILNCIVFAPDINRVNSNFQ